MLDGENQIGHALDLVDDQQAIVPDKRRRVGARSGANGGIVQVSDLGARPTVDDQPGEGALPCLACSVEDDHPRVTQRSAYAFVRAARVKVIEHMPRLLSGIHPMAVLPTYRWMFRRGGRGCPAADLTGGGRRTSPASEPAARGAHQLSGHLDIGSVPSRISCGRAGYTRSR